VAGRRIFLFRRRRNGDSALSPLLVSPDYNRWHRRSPRRTLAAHVSTNRAGTRSMCALPERGRRALAGSRDGGTEPASPEQADRLTDAGDVETVSVDQLAVGDVVASAGDKNPGGWPDDRRVSRSTSDHHGESLPRTKGPGDLVSAGTLNLNGSLDIEVLADAATAPLPVSSSSSGGGGPTGADRARVKRFALVYTPIVTALAILVMVRAALLLGEPGWSGSPRASPCW